MERVSIATEFIKLDQFLKWANICSSGVEAKIVISEEKVKCNGEVVTQRGKKIRPGDKVEVQGKVFLVEKE